MHLSFGRFVLDVRARQLLRRGRPVRLGDSALAVLLRLVERRPAVVSKVDLRSLWPSRVVEENHLSHLIAELRRALGRRAIRTVHGLGYAFTPSAIPDAATAVGAVVCVLEWRAGSGLTASGHHDAWDAGRARLPEGTYLIGRSPDAFPRLASRTVSARHAHLDVHADGAFVEDLASKNGTFVEGRRVDLRRRLRDGDTLLVGGVPLSVHLHGAALTTTDTLARRAEG
jgi:hypothetical protein